MKANSISLRILVRALLGAGVLLAAPNGFGRDFYDGTWDTLYPNSSSDDNARCALCHGSTSSGFTFNAYGSAIRYAPGSTLAARIAAVEGVNSDKDPSGSSNLAEIRANTQPGWSGTAVYGVVGSLDPATTLPDESPPEIASPDVNVSPVTLSFGSVDVGTTRTLQTTVSNAGGAELEVTGLGFRTGTSGDFDLNTAPETPFTIPASGVVKVLVDYTPGGDGGDTGALEIKSDSPGEELVTVSLSGTGVVPADDECAISVNPLALDFGSVEVDTAKALTAKVTNAGSLACEVDAVVSSADDTFNLASSDSFTVNPGTSAYVRVEYLPAYLGDDAGTLDLSSNDPDNASIAVPLSGTGVEAVAVGGEVGDALPNLELDLDIAKLAVKRRAWLSGGTPIAVRVMVQNGGVTEGEAEATLIGVQNGKVVYKESRLVTDGPGKGKTMCLFPAYMPQAAGTINWEVTIDDSDSDDDVAKATTTVMNRGPRR